MNQGSCPICGGLADHDVNWCRRRMAMIQAQQDQEDQERADVEAVRYGVAVACLKNKLQQLADGYIETCVAEGIDPDQWTVDDFILATFHTMFDIYAIEGNTEHPREFLREWVKVRADNINTPVPLDPDKWGA